MPMTGVGRCIAVLWMMVSVAHTEKLQCVHGPVAAGLSHVAWLTCCPPPPTASQAGILMFSTVTSVITDEMAQAQVVTDYTATSLLTGKRICTGFNYAVHPLVLDLLNGGEPERTTDDGTECMNLVINGQADGMISDRPLVLYQQGLLDPKLTHTLLLEGNVFPILLTAGECWRRCADWWAKWRRVLVEVSGDATLIV